MGRVMEKMLSLFKTKKQAERADNVERAVQARKKASLELSQALDELTAARERKRQNHGAT